MTRNVFRRIQQLETRAFAATSIKPFSMRIILVDPEEGATGVLVLGSDSSTEVPPTQEEKESVWASLQKRKALWKATDIAGYRLDAVRRVRAHLIKLTCFEPLTLAESVAMMFSVWFPELSELTFKL